MSDSNKRKAVCYTDDESLIKKLKPKSETILTPFQFDSPINPQTGSILSLVPNEILILVLMNLNLVDLDSFARTCKTFYNVFTFFLTQPIELSFLLPFLNLNQSHIIQKRKFISLISHNSRFSHSHKYNFLANWKITINQIFLHSDSHFSLDWICSRIHKLQPLNIKTTPVSLSLSWLSISLLRYFYEFTINIKIPKERVSKKEFISIKQDIGHNITINGAPLSENEFVNYDDFAKEMDKITPTQNFIKVINLIKDRKLLNQERLIVFYGFLGKYAHHSFYNSIYFVFLRYIKQRFEIN